MQALWMLFASAMFAVMGSFVKLAAEHGASMPQIVLFRGLPSVVLLLIYARAGGLSFIPAAWTPHLWRNLTGVSSMWLGFYAIAKLPLATSMTLNYMSSVWIAAFIVGGSLINWKPGQGQSLGSQGALAVAVLTGFAGVVMVLRPTMAQDQIYAGLIGLMSGFFAAFAYMQVTALGRVGEPETRTVFYFACGTTLAGLFGMAGLGVSSWSWPHALWLLPLGLMAAQRTGTLAQTPTMAEAGLPGYESATNYTLFAPAGTPKDIVALLNKETNAILQMPDVREKLQTQGIVITGGSVDAVERRIPREVDKWTKVVKASHLKFD